MKKLRWDLLSLPIVAFIIGFVVLKFAGAGKAGDIFVYYVWWPACGIFVLYWLLKGQIRK